MQVGINAAPEPLQTGTSFPVSPTAGDRFRRSDINYLIFFYDGSRWRSETIMTLQDGSSNASTAADTWHMANPKNTWDGLGAWWVAFGGHIYIATTNNGSHYWVATPTGSGLSALNTSAMTPNNYRDIGGRVGALFSGGTGVLRMNWTKVGSPGARYSNLALYYQLVAT